MASTIAPTTDQAPLSSALAGPGLSPILREMLETGTALDESGAVHQIGAHLSLEHCTALYNAVLHLRPSVVVEIGMAYGTSALAILSALTETGGRLISIDPDELTQWNGVGVASVKRAGFSEQHELIADFDYLALPELLRRGERIDFAYIDGWHTFDYTLLDFFYIDKMLSAGGMVGFNDCDLRAVHRVIKFVKRYRHYTEVDVGLKRDYSTGQIGRTLSALIGSPGRAENAWKLVRSTAFSVCLALEGRPSNDRYFRKDEHWEPNWKFYTSF